MTDAPVVVLLPALNEEACVREVVKGFQAEGARALVIDNGSVDRTAVWARAAGAEVVEEPRRGYGRACLAGLRRLAADPPQVVVFADCDGSADPGALALFVRPILDDHADVVLGSTMPGAPARGPMHQHVGNRLIDGVVRLLYGRRSPATSSYRAVSWSCLHQLGLREETYGLPVETVCRALLVGARILHLPVAQRPRSGGKSKVSGTVGGTVRAASTMVQVALRVRLERGRHA